MKSLVKKATALMITGAVAFASVAIGATGNDDLVKVKKTSTLRHEINPITNSMKVILGVMMEESQKVKLEILDNQDRVVHKHTYKDTDGFMQMFDLGALGKGEYIFRITSGNTTYIDKVQVGCLSKQEESLQVYFSGIENEKVKFSYADGKGNVTLSVIDSQGEKIFTKSLGNEHSSSGIANISKLLKGNYTMKISSASGSESKSFEVK